MMLRAAQARNDVGVDPQRRALEQIAPIIEYAATILGAGAGSFLFGTASSPLSQFFGIPEVQRLAQMQAASTI